MEIKIEVYPKPGYAILKEKSLSDQGTVVYTTMESHVTSSLYADM